jgi:hypothetical protein
MSSSELALVRALLDGFVEQDGRGNLRTKYLRKGSPEETDARRELAEHLRSDGAWDRGILRSLEALFDLPARTLALVRWARMRVAALFDPPKGARLRVVVGRPGRSTDPIRNTQIAAHVYAEIKGGKNRPAAVASAAAQFCLSQRMIENIWDRYRAYDALLTG